jgi:hypothetical protein
MSINSEFKNSKKERFLKEIPDISLETQPLDSAIYQRCKFNFSYFIEQGSIGKNFNDLSKEQLSDLLDKLKHYSRQPLMHWKCETIGKGNGHVLEVYDKFPNHSKFKHPKHIPYDVLWARFRLESDARLVGFVIPDSLHDTMEAKATFRFDKNTFYVVFLDPNHQFYPSKK